MKIQAEKWMVNNRPSYKIKHAEKCCEDILKLEKYLALNNEYAENDVFEGDEEYCVKLFKEEDYGDYTNTCYKKIRFCPCCGEKIEIEIIGEVDKTEHYEKLRIYRDELWKKYINTDSKKMSEQLREIISEFDREINYLLADESFFNYFLI